MKKIGITTTIPVEVIFASGNTPIDLNNIVVSSSDMEKHTTSTLKIFKWGKDRFSHLGYDLFTIYFCKKFDCYLFKYKENSYITRHKDTSFGYDHHIRFNFVLKIP